MFILEAARNLPRPECAKNWCYLLKFTVVGGFRAEFSWSFRAIGCGKGYRPGICSCRTTFLTLSWHWITYPSNASVLSKIARKRGRIDETATTVSVKLGVCFSLTEKGFEPNIHFSFSLTGYLGTTFTYLAKATRNCNKSKNLWAYAH